MIGEEHNITMPPEEMKEWNGMDGGEQDLKRACLQQMLEWSCWIINNEKHKLDMVLWNTSQNYEVTTCHSRKKIGLIRTMRRETISPGG